MKQPVYVCMCMFLKPNHSAFQRWASPKIWLIGSQEISFFVTVVGESKSMKVMKYEI